MQAIIPPVALEGAGTEKGYIQTCGGVRDGRFWRGEALTRVLVSRVYPCGDVLDIGLGLLIID